MPLLNDRHDADQSAKQATDDHNRGTPARADDEPECDGHSRRDRGVAGREGVADRRRRCSTRAAQQDVFQQFRRHHAGRGSRQADHQMPEPAPSQADDERERNPTDRKDDLAAEEPARQAEPGRVLPRHRV